MKTLKALAQERDRDAVSKTLDYYAIYDHYFAEHRDSELKIAEIGVYEGVGLKVLAEFFSRAQLIGIDLVKREIDFSAHKNVRYEVCDQTDAERLHGIIDQFAPDGLDIVIDDASHVGLYSLKTFEALFPRLKVGGLYIVEDWGTGYWDDWQDGSRYQPHPVSSFDGWLPKRLPSHDFGMVGFVKHLVDLAGGSAIRPRLGDPQKRNTPVEFLHIYHGVVVIKKADELEVFDAG